MKINMAVISSKMLLMLLTIQLLMRRSIVVAVFIDYPRNITCHTCGNTVYPNNGCNMEPSDGPEFSENFDDVMADGCHQCGIRMGWILNPQKRKWRLREFDRTCYTSHRDIDDDPCTFLYPAGSRGIVYETCRCMVDLCNDHKEIEDLGGTTDHSKFPPPRDEGKLARWSGATITKAEISMKTYTVCYLIWILVKTYCYE